MLFRCCQFTHIWSLGFELACKANPTFPFILASSKYPVSPSVEAQRLSRSLHHVILLGPLNWLLNWRSTSWEEVTCSSILRLARYFSVAGLGEGKAGGHWGDKYVVRGGIYIHGPFVVKKKMFSHKGQIKGVYLATSSFFPSSMHPPSHAPVTIWLLASEKERKLSVSSEYSYLSSYTAVYSFPYAM